MARARTAIARLGPALSLHLDPRPFRDLLPAKGSLLALDVSKRRLGLAGTDIERRLVTPLVTLDRNDRAAVEARLRRLVAERAVVGLVVGWPLNMDGSAGPACQSVRAFAERLHELLALPVLLQDERLTTAAVEQAIEEGKLPRPRRATPLDHYAAAVILEDALRALRS